jgi:pSer/pThr/pTyr-binding forkhead associated (FHA) protein
MQTEAAYARGFGDNDDTDPPIPRGGNPRRGGMGRADPLDEDQTYIPHRKGGGGGDDDQTQINYKREPRKQQGPLGFLIESVGPRRGRVYRIEDGTIVGRTTGDLLIDDADISRSHARFRLEEEQFTLTDFASENGTFVNGEKIRAETPLIENDVIEMGSRTFVFKVLLGTGKPAKKKNKAAG